MRPTRPYIALADSFEIKVFDANGKALPSLIARVPRVAATKADLEAAREQEIAMVGADSRKPIESDYARIPLAKDLPATRDLIVDADANVWVQHYPRTSSRTVTWRVYAPDGTVRAAVALPTTFELCEAGRDYVLRRYTDPDDAVPEVRMYRLSRR